MFNEFQHDDILGAKLAFLNRIQSIFLDYKKLFSLNETKRKYPSYPRKGRWFLGFLEAQSSVFDSVP